MNKALTYSKLAMKFVKGVFSFRKKAYDLQFVYEPGDNLWYIDMPWPGDRYNLAMVAGADKLLDRLSSNDRTPGLRKHNRVRVMVNPSRKQLPEMMKEGYIECVQQYATITGGSTYRVYGLTDFTREIWICPVTLTVLGHYPKYIYIKKMPLN